MPGIHDVTQYIQPIVGNAHNFSAYATLGDETGSLVANPGQGRYAEYGVNFFTPKEGIYAAYHDVGPEYAPIDGFNQISDVHGPTVYASKEFDSNPKDFVQSVIVSQDFGLMHDHSGVLNYAYNSTYITFATRTHWFLGVSSGNQYVRFPAQPGGFTDQNGVQLHVRLQHLDAERPFLRYGTIRRRIFAQRRPYRILALPSLRNHRPRGVSNQRCARQRQPLGAVAGTREHCIPNRRRPIICAGLAADRRYRPHVFQRAIVYKRNESFDGILPALERKRVCILPLAIRTSSTRVTVSF